MSDPTVIAGGVVLVIGSMATAIVTIINALAARDDRRAQATERLTSVAARATQLEATHDASRKADTIIEKATEIHALTNGTNQGLTKALDLANAKISGLEQEVASLKQMMALLLTAKQDALTLATATREDAANVAARSREDIASALAQAPPPTRRTTDRKDPV